MPITEVFSNDARLADLTAWNPDANEVSIPSLKTIVPQAIATAFEGAIIEAADQTKLPESAFPAVCPWSFDQLMDARFWPE